MLKFNWNIDHSSKTSVYLQIHDLIKNSIINNDLKIGEKLSQRKVAEIFNVSKVPVADAFRMLEAEGFITTKPQSGTVVSNNVWALLHNETPSFWESFLKSGRQKDMPAGLTSIFEKLEPYPRFFGDRIPSSFHPNIPLTKAIKKALPRIENAKEWGFFHFGGIEPLKNTLVEHLKRYGIETTAKNIIVTQGIGESLMIISLGLLNNGINLIYETPSFVNTIMLLQSTGVNMEQIPMDMEGIDIEKLISKLNRTKHSILYTQPVNHNPTGLHMSKNRRNALLGACNSLRVPIIENDMFRDFVFDKQFPKPLKAFDKNEQVIYVGSLWSGFTGFKTSWIVAPEFIIERLKYVKVNFELVPNNVVEIIVDEMLKNGYYYEYMESLSPIITKQYHDIRNLFDKYLSKVANWLTPAPSFFIWIEFDKRINVVKSHQASEDMLFFQGNMFDWSDTNHARINTLGVEPDKLEEWMKTISCAMKYS